jgi:repressor LexA
MTPENTNTKERLTARQQEVLDFIRSNMAYYSPAVREIGRAMNIRSPNGVVCHLDALERKGRIRRTPGKSRNIQVIS